MEKTGGIVLADTQKNNLTLENIKGVQDKLKANVFANYLSAIKKVKQQLERTIEEKKISQQRTQEEEKVKNLAKKQEEGKALQEQIIKNANAKMQDKRPEVQPKPIQTQSVIKNNVENKPDQPQSNRTQTRFFGNKEQQSPQFRQKREFYQRSNNNDKPGFRNNNSNAYNQGVMNGYRNSNKQNVGDRQGQQRPLGQRQSTSRMSKPVIEYDASKIIKKDVSHTPKKKVFEKPDDKKSMNKKALINRGYIEDQSLADEDYVVSGSHKKSKKVKEQEQNVAPRVDHAIITTENLTVKILAEKIGRPVTEIMGKFLMLGMMVNINSNIDYDSAELIASELGVTLERKLEKTMEEQIAEQYAQEEDLSKMVKRPPVITVMGHVDHGKTSLLDAIRKSHVAVGEAGGITQHIGAYTINVNNQMITFIDTPGHAAFTAMRKRGANLTDIAILVVAADDGVMPQTIEAIKFIKEAKVPMIVAINKIDVVGANVDKIKQQLTEHDVVCEEWGGDTIMIPISAKTGENLDKLIEMILFVSDYLELKANPNREATGAIIESRLDKGMGAVATVLVQNGTLKLGDYVLVGTSSGKVRGMIDDKGKNIKSAGPSVPVSILGLGSVPNAGDQLYVVDEKVGKQAIAERVEKERMGLIKKADTSVDTLMNKITEANFKDYNVIVKGDVAGSVEALKETLGAIANDEVKVRCIHGGVGAINENDVMLAQASHAVIIGFNVKPDFKAKILAEKYKVDVKFYKIIYEATEFVSEEIEKLKTPKFKEVVIGHAEIRQLFKASKVGVIAGSHVVDGKITKLSKVRITRGDKLIFEGPVNTLQREREEVKEVSSGFDFGVTFEGFQDLMVGDIIEAYVMEKI